MYSTPPRVLAKRVSLASMEVAANRLLDAKQAVLTRRSIRKFKQEPVPQGTLEEILSLALKAPSAWNSQPWRFVVVRDPSLKMKLRAAANDQSQVTSAPVVIVLYSDMKDALERAGEVMHPGIPEAERPARLESIRASFASKTNAEREAWGMGQSYIALGFLMLLARSYGYDTVPMLGFNAAKVKELLGLPERVAIPALLPLGLRDEEGRPHHRHNLEQVVRWM